MISIKVVNLEKLYNFIVQHYFIWIHLEFQNMIWIYLYWVPKMKHTAKTTLKSSLPWVKHTVKTTLCHVSFFLAQGKQHLCLCRKTRRRFSHIAKMGFLYWLSWIGHLGVLYLYYTYTQPGWWTELIVSMIDIQKSGKFLLYHYNFSHPLFGMAILIYSLSYHVTIPYYVTLPRMFEALFYYHDLSEMAILQPWSCAHAQVAVAMARCTPSCGATQLLLRLSAWCPRAPQLWMKIS